MVKGSKMSAEQRARISASMRGKPSHRKGKRLPETHRKNISEGLRVAWARRRGDAS